MEWTQEAEDRIHKAPFFIRGFARRKAEEMAKARGKLVVELEDVEAAKGTRELEDVSKIDLTVEGVQDSKYKEIKPCGGLRGCPLTLFKDEEVVLSLEKVLQQLKVEESIVQRTEGPILYHHKFKAAVSGCPNCCSQPQIKDIGIIGYSRPMVTKGHCVGCQQCIKACPEKLVMVDVDPIIDFNQCIDCGRCIKACPTSSITVKEKGYRVIIGGRLGRRPFLGRQLAEVETLSELEVILEEILQLYLDFIEEGRNFSKSIESMKIDDILQLQTGISIR